jgi:hypothetical protein
VALVVKRTSSRVDLQLRQQRGRSAITRLRGLLITQQARTRVPIILLLQHIGSTSKSLKGLPPASTFEDIVAILQKYQGKTDDTIVFDTIGITDTTGNMGKFGRYLCDNGKENGHCMNHNLHLVAKLEFECEIVLVLKCFHFFITSSKQQLYL